MEKIAEYIRQRIFRLLQQRFLFSSVYLPLVVCIQKTVQMGFHIEMEQFEGTWVLYLLEATLYPLLQLRKALEKTEDQMMKTNENISAVKKQLEDPELDEDLRDEMRLRSKNKRKKDWSMQSGKNYQT